MPDAAVLPCAPAVKVSSAVPVMQPVNPRELNVATPLAIVAVVDTKVPWDEVTVTTTSLLPVSTAPWELMSSTTNDANAAPTFTEAVRPAAVSPVGFVDLKRMLKAGKGFTVIVPVTSLFVAASSPLPDTAVNVSIGSVG